MLDFILGPQKIGPKNTVNVCACAGNGVETCFEIVYFPKYSARFRKGAYVLEVNGFSFGKLRVENSISYFHAMIELRNELEKMRLSLCCWGARKDVWPSGMQADMGAGLMASSRINTDQHIEHSIFDRISCRDSVTVEEHIKFVEELNQ